MNQTEGESYPATEQEEDTPSDIPTDPGTLQAVAASKLATAPLFRNPYILILVLSYAGTAVARWVILCILNVRPITTKTNHGNYNTSTLFLRNNTNPFVLSERWFRVAKVLLTIANTLAVPLTSTVCASAAVTYVERSGSRSDFRMSHTANLADRRWTSPLVALAFLTPKGRKFQGPYFLVFAMCLAALVNSFVEASADLKA